MPMEKISFANEAGLNLSACLDNAPGRHPLRRCPADFSLPIIGSPTRPMPRTPQR
jgi:hypothetical protein